MEQAHACDRPVSGPRCLMPSPLTVRSQAPAGGCTAERKRWSLPHSAHMPYDYFLDLADHPVLRLIQRRMS